MKPATHKKRIEKRAGQLRDELNDAVIDRHFSKPHVEVHQFEYALHDLLCELERQYLDKHEP